MLKQLFNFSLETMTKTMEEGTEDVRREAHASRHALSDGPKIDDVSKTLSRIEVKDVFEDLEQLIKTQSSNLTSPSTQEALVDMGTPTVSVAIMDAGHTTSKVLGSPTQYNNDTLFQAASISKAVTALALIKLCQQGVLDLDAHISSYLSQEQLSWISTPRTLALVSQITLRQLVSHTSGLSCHGFPGYPTTAIPSLEQIFRGEAPANNDPVRMTFMPGTRFSYSGGGFTVIQYILEAQLKKPFPQIMDEMVLQPLKMTRSTFQRLPESEKNYAPAYWNGKTKTEPEYHILPELAAAGLWTTPSDLLKVIYAIQQSLQEDGFIEQKWARELLTEVEENCMALGWVTGKRGNHFQHAGGNDPGYRCIVLGFAELSGESDKEVLKDREVSHQAVPKDCGISVMTNSAMGDVLHQKIVAAVSFLKGWPSLRLSDDSEATVPFIARSKSVDVRATEWVGDWGPGLWKIESDKEVLFIRHGIFPPIPLLPGASPSAKYDAGSSIDLVADGLELMLRLGWKDGSQIVELWQEGEVKVLKRE
jgi:CubicO group peptidase (beta-lactamase class C family)